MFETSDLISLFIIIFSLLFLFLSSFIIFFIYRYKQKQNLHSQQLLNLQSIHDNAILQAQLEMQEQTFVNISREIHDNVGQKLALSKLQLIGFQQSNYFSEVDGIIETIATAIQDLSDLSRTMSTDAVLANGFIHAMQFEVQQLNKTFLFTTSMQIEGEAVFLDGNRELIVFRIVQEALQNVVKHANASLVHILINYSPEFLILTIKDNGRGFNSEIHAGLGLKNIQARINLLKGNYVLNSGENIGTTLTISIPIRDAASSN